MTARSAFDLLMQCAVARRGNDGDEKNRALQAVCTVLSDEIRRILTPEDERAGEGKAS